MFEGELYGTLKKTKTTGPAKRVRELPLHISKSAYIRFGSWLRVGYDLWLTLAPFDRDYFLPKSDAAGHYTVRQMATYSDAASSGIEVLARLKLPGADRLLLDHNWCTFFTEHSERPTMTTALAVLQHSKEERDLIGRWRPEGSDVYVRTYHAIVSRLQAQVAEAMKSVNRFDILQEKEIAKSFRDWSRDRLQLTEDEAETVSGIFADTLRLPPIHVQESTLVPSVDLTQTILSDDEPLAEEEDDSSEDPEPDAWFLAKNRPQEAFLIIRSGKGARLHRTNGCWTARYRAVKNPQLCQKEPSNNEYDFRCRLCWPSSLPADEVSSQDSSDSEVEQQSEEEHLTEGLVQQPIGHEVETASNWSLTFNAHTDAQDEEPS
jgi:hypothetical protein